MTELVDGIRFQEATPFTKRAITFAIFSSFAWVLAQSFVGPLSGFYVTGEGALAMVFLATIMFRGRLHPFEQALIFGMVEVASIVAIEIGAMVAAPLAIGAFSYLSPLLEVVPDFFRIPGPDIEAALQGGSLIPMSLAPTILLMFSINSAIFLLIILTSLLLRKEFVEFERLPFPVARASYTITKIFSPTYSIEQEFERRIFWEGLIIGFLLVSVTEGYFLSQELPFLQLIPSSFNESIFQSLNSLLPGALMGFSWGGAVWTMWLLYLAPVESTLTAATINFFAYMLLAPLQVAFGFIGWNSSMSYGEFYAKLYHGEAISYSWLSIGLLLSSATVPFVMRYRHFHQKGFSDVQKWKYHALTLTLLLTFVFIGSHLMTMPLLLSVFIVAITLLGYNVWLTRTLAELNTIKPNENFFIASAWALGSSFMGFRLGAASREAYGTIVTSYLLSSNATVGAGCTEAFTLASLAGMRSRDMMVVIIFGVLIAALVGPLIYLSILYAYGFPSSPSDPRGILWSLTANSLGSDAALSYLIRGKNHYTINLPSGIAGFIAGALAILLRARFRFLPVSVVAMGIGFVTDPGSGFLFFLIPGLARLITIKVGGIRLYERFGLPLFTGISCGAILGTLISSLNILRYL